MGEVGVEDCGVVWGVVLIEDCGVAVALYCEMGGIVKPFNTSEGMVAGFWVTFTIQEFVMRLCYFDDISEQFLNKQEETEK